MLAGFSDSLVAVLARRIHRVIVRRRGLAEEAESDVSERTADVTRAGAMAPPPLSSDS